MEKKALYEAVDAITERVAMIQREGWDLAKVELIDDTPHRGEPDYRPVTEAEWQHWLDVIAMAPQMWAILQEIHAMSGLMPDHSAKIADLVRRMAR